MIDTTELRRLRDTLGKEPSDARDGFWVFAGFATEHAHAIADELDALRKRPKWRCYHCSFETDNDKEAEAHFGEEDGVPALCLEWASWTHDERVKELQSTIAELHAEREETEQLRKRVAEASDWIECHLSSDEPPSEWDEGYQQACLHLRGILDDGKETA